MDILKVQCIAQRGGVSKNETRVKVDLRQIDITQVEIE